MRHFEVAVLNAMVPPPFLLPPQDMCIPEGLLLQLWSRNEEDMEQSGSRLIRNANMSEKETLTIIIHYNLGTLWKMKLNCA